MRKLRILVLMHDYLVPPDDVSGIDLMAVPWKTEHDVVVTLQRDGARSADARRRRRPGVVRRTVEEWKPHIVFNLMEAFHELGTFDHNVVSYLELLRVPYTGCNPRGLMLARDKALSKTILHYHRIPVPEFAVVHVGRKVRRPKRLRFPLIVKSLTQEASTGISQASVVDDDDKLRERVHVHPREHRHRRDPRAATSRAASSTSASSATSGCTVFPGLGAPLHQACATKCHASPPTG